MTQECRDRDITIAPAPGRVQVYFGDTLVADTTEALDLTEPGYGVVAYIPRSAISAKVLGASAHHTTCPFKGVASYHDLKQGDHVAPNAVWYYSDPCPLVEPIRDHVAFWGDQVRITRS